MSQDIKFYITAHRDRNEDSDLVVWCKKRLIEGDWIAMKGFDQNTASYYDTIYFYTDEASVEFKLRWL
jgi:hypothetical protein